MIDFNLLACIISKRKYLQIDDKAGRVMFERRIYWAISAYFFFFFVSFAACYSLYSIWLSKSLGLNGTDSGIVFGLNAAVTLVAQPLYGYIQDKNKELLFAAFPTIDSDNLYSFLNKVSIYSRMKSVNLSREG